MKSSIVSDNGSFFLEINGGRVPLYGYMTYLPERGRYADFSDAGVPLAFVPVYLGDRGINQETALRPFLRGIWTGEDEYDFSPAEEAFRSASAGGALLIPRIMTEPPSWWDAAHPEELCRSYTGEPAHASFSSRRRMADVTECLRAFYRWTVTSGWSERIAAWHLAGGNTEEFLRPLPHPHFFDDYSAPAVCAWKAFSGEDRDPPSPFERTAGGERAALYNEFLSSAAADAVIGLCRAGKRITGGTIPMGAFYGYLVNVTDPRRGHAALSRVLESEDVDFLASPFAYTGGRALGTDWPIPGPVASARLHGKPWFVEADVRTCLTGPLKEASPESAPKVNRLYEGGVWAGPPSEEKSLSAMKKALGSILASGCAAWWFDMWGGWYDSPAFMEFQKKACEIFRDARFSSPSSVRADTAVFLSEEFILKSSDPGFVSAAHEGLLCSLARTGAAYDVFDRADLSRVDPAPYRAAIFPGERGELPAFGNAVRIGTCAEGEPDGSPSPDVLVRNGARIFPDRREIRFADPNPGPSELAFALSAAGAHLFSHTGDVCRAGGEFVTLHAVSGGVKRIFLPREGTLTDAFTGEEVSVSDAYAEFAMEAGETRIFRIKIRFPA